MDYTRLEENDKEEDIRAFLEGAHRFKLAAVCVLPKWVRLAKSILDDTATPVATVANFPQGQSSMDDVLLEIESIKASNADELDVVLPYRAFQAGQGDMVTDFLRTIRLAWPNKILKCILETGCLTSAETKALSELAIQMGADFIKTSTGKTTQGASLNAAEQMCRALQSRGSRAGIKISGGVSTYAEACQYLTLISELLGSDAVVASRCRIGASRLLNDLLRIDPELA